jgi:hypothetical protein
LHLALGGIDSDPMKRWSRWPVVLGVAVVMAIAVFVPASVTVAAYTGGIQLPTPISKQQAITDALANLPNGGAGFTVVASQYEPSSKHYVAAFDGGGSFGGDQAPDCFVLTALPFIRFGPCHYHPVWVVEMTMSDCQLEIAINAFKGDFGGMGASGACPQPNPQVRDNGWFTWQ